MNKTLRDVAKNLYQVPNSISCKVCITCKEDEEKKRLSCLDCIEYGLQELIDRAAPKKLRESHYEVDGEKLYLKYKCPNGCNIQLTPITEKNNAYEVRYCPKCGQKIWSEYLDEELEISDKEWEKWNR